MNGFERSQRDRLFTRGWEERWQTLERLPSGTVVRADSELELNEYQEIIQEGRILQRGQLPGTGQGYELKQMANQPNGAKVLLIFPPRTAT